MVTPGRAGPQQVPPGLRRRVGRNAVAAAVQAMVGGLLVFATYKVLIGMIGTAGVGSWSLALAVSAMATLPSIGIQGAVQHHVASRVALGDVGGAADVMATSAVAVSVLLTVGCAAVLALLPYVLPGLAGGRAAASPLSLAPWAVASAWLLGMSTLLQAGLDALQRTTTRSWIYLGATLFYAIAAVVLTGRLGIRGLGWANALEYALLCLVLAAGFVHALGRDRAFAGRPRLSVLRDIFGYSAGAQLMGIGSLLCDPIAKLLLGRYAGLSEIGVFDMASRMVVQVRTVIVSAVGILVPVFSSGGPLVDGDATGRRRYVEVLGLVTSVTTALMLGLVGCAPVVARILLGESTRFFVLSTALLCAGWGLNTVASPAYMVNMGQALLKWNVVGQYAMLAMLAVLGTVLAPHSGGLGVVWAWSLALGFGGFVPLIALHRRMRVAAVDWWGALDRPLVVMAVLGCVTGWSAYGVFMGVAPAFAMLALVLFSTVPAFVGLYRGRTRDLFVGALSRADDQG